MPQTSTISVVIVNYKTPDLTIRCVRSILDQKIAEASAITVVDNRSGDNSLEKFATGLPKGVNVIASDRNAGFGAGINIGAQGLTSQYLLVLNPDTIFAYDSVSEIRRFMDQRPDVGIVGLDLVNPDGSRQYSARRFYSVLDIAARRVKPVGRLLGKRVERHLMMDAWRSNTPFDAEWVMGTGLVIRRDVFERIGGMDERYFLYMEDVDLCARVWGAGFRVMCCPGAQLIHDHQRSSAASPFSFAGRKHLESLMLFARLHRLPLVRSPGLQKFIGRDLPAVKSPARPSTI